KSPVLPGVPEALGGKFPRIKPVALSLTASCPDKRPFVVADTLAASQNALRAARDHLGKTIERWAGEGFRGAGIRQGDGLVLAGLDYRLAEGRLTSLQAVLRAEALEDAGQKDTGAWTQAAQAATISQRRTAALEARRNLLAARQLLGKAKAPARPAASKKA